MQAITEQERQQFAEYQAIVQTLQPYIDASKTGQAEKLPQVFLEHARIVGSVDGHFAALTVEEFTDFVAQHGPSELVQHHITWIDISGPAAAARVEFVDWLGFRFTDFFVLYKEQGGWRISGKVYNSLSRN